MSFWCLWRRRKKNRFSSQVPIFFPVTLREKANILQIKQSFYMKHYISDTIWGFQRKISLNLAQHLDLVISIAFPPWQTHCRLSAFCHFDFVSLFIGQRKSTSAVLPMSVCESSRWLGNTLNWIPGLERLDEQMALQSPRPGKKRQYVASWNNAGQKRLFVWDLAREMQCEPGVKLAKDRQNNCCTHVIKHHLLQVLCWCSRYFWIFDQLSISYASLHRTRFWERERERAQTTR